MLRANVWDSVQFTSKFLCIVIILESRKSHLNWTFSFHVCACVFSIIDGTSGVEPDVCETDFPRIVKCMADGRNHLPCCERKKIPDVCQDMCQGDYTPFTDYVRSRVSCVAHTLPALKCILEGVQVESKVLHS